MATPAKTIPEIPVTIVIVDTDKFLTKIPGAERPEQVEWGQMLSQSLSAAVANH